MIAKNTTRDQLEQALAKINADKFENNITWRRAPEVLNSAGTRHRFTLRAVDSKGKGGRLGHPHSSWTTRKGEAYKQRRIGQSACWHAHGHFFDALFEIAPDAVILAGAQTITKDAGNWEDRNIGSMMEPFYYSEACECTE